MSKSRRNKSKHPADARKGGGHAPAGKQSTAPGVESAAEESVQSGSDQTAHEQVFSSDDASEADALMAEFAATDDVEDAQAAPTSVEAEVIQAGVEAVPMVEAETTAANITAADTPAPDAVASVADTAVDSASAVEPSDRRGRRGKRHDKPTTAKESKEDPVAPVDLVVPAGPRAPAMQQLAEYERLSLAHIAGTPQQSDAPGHWRGVGFRLGARRLAAAFDEVVEILSMPQVTHVPGAQPWMLGVANVRGTLLPVVDLKQFLEGERTVIHEAQRILVVRQTGGNVAVLIDELFGQRSFNDAQMVKTDDEEGRYGYFVKQVYRVGDFDWGVFSMSMLTRTPEFRQAAA